MKKFFSGIVLLIGIAAVGYLGMTLYFVYSFSKDCGMNDGPFKAIRIDPVEISDSAIKLDLAGNSALFIDNRTEELSPIIILVEDGDVKWALDTDVRNTKGYEKCRIRMIDNIRIRKNSDPIKIEFTGHWTYGAEYGFMEIKRADGDNRFCLSW